MLAEVYRGDSSDAGVDRLFVSGVRRVGLDLRTARTAGDLRARARAGSAVDAIVVGTAVRLGGALIATSDLDNLATLAADSPTVAIWSLNDTIES
jgi:hypothetical protein